MYPAGNPHSLEAPPKRVVYVREYYREAPGTPSAPAPVLNLPRPDLPERPARPERGDGPPRRKSAGFAGPRPGPDGGGKRAFSGAGKFAGGKRNFSESRQPAASRPPVRKAAPKRKVGAKPYVAAPPAKPRRRGRPS